MYIILHTRLVRHMDCHTTSQVSVHSNNTVKCKPHQGNNETLERPGTEKKEYKLMTQATNSQKPRSNHDCQLHKAMHSTPTSKSLRFSKYIQYTNTFTIHNTHLYIMSRKRCHSTFANADQFSKFFHRET